MFSRLLIDAAEKIDDLRVPPGNRLEKLSGDLSGKYSIGINNQLGIVFEWFKSNAYEVRNYSVGKFKTIYAPKETNLTTYIIGVDIVTVAILVYLFGNINVGG